MSGILDKKLGHFKTLIFDDINKTIKAAQEESDQKESLLIEQKRKSLQDESDKFYKLRVEQMHDVFDQMISGANLKHSKEALAIRRDILNETIIAIEKKAATFADGEACQKIVADKLEDIKAELSIASSIVVSIRDVDKPWVEGLFKEIGYRGELLFDELPRNEIGGIIVTFTERHIRYKLTLKYMIDTKMDDIGTKLYQLLEEMED